MEKVLQQERARSSLSSEALGCFLYGEKYFKDLKNYLEAGPTLVYTPNIYNRNRIELVKDALRYFPVIFNYNVNHNKPTLHPHIRTVYGQLASPHQLPGGVHFGMFIKYLELMGTEEHQKLYLEKSWKCEIIGCYAQTELGHGSDIRSLETVAEYDPSTK